MNKIILAVGSKRGPKLNAVNEALAAFSSLLAPDAQFEVIGVEVESGVGHTPSSCEELMRGARQRAESLLRLARTTGAAWSYFIGLEGGLEVVYERMGTEETLEHSRGNQNGRRRVFLESWAYVTDGSRGHFGRSGGIELPDVLAHEVLEKGTELSLAIDCFAVVTDPDQFAEAAGIRDAQGAWGVLSGNFITRQEAFRVAVTAAFAPFYNSKMYRAAAGTALGSIR